MSNGEINSESLKGRLGTTGGVRGMTYPKGDSGEIQIGQVQTGEPNSNVEITNTGTKSHAILNFKIPRGKGGYSVGRISRTSGSGIPGQNDTYTVYLNDPDETPVGTITVHNGADGGVTIIIDSEISSTSENPVQNKVIYNALNTKVNIADIIDNLLSNDNTKVLSAKQGKVLNTLIGVLSQLTTTDKTSIVTAINEIVTDLGTKVNTLTYDTKMSSLDTSIVSLTNNKLNAKYYESTVDSSGSTADFTVNSTIAAETGVEYKVHFAACSANKNARLSVDDGTTFYSVDNCKGIALGGEYLRALFDGIKFVIMTDLGPSIIENV